jgi:hypothetical protein
MLLLIGWPLLLSFQARQSAGAQGCRPQGAVGEILGLVEKLFSRNGHTSDHCVIEELNSGVGLEFESDCYKTKQ